MHVAANISGLIADALICLGSALAIILVFRWIWQVARQALHRHPPEQ
jgi:hypothetical protein